MPGTRERGRAIRDYILGQVRAHPKDIAQICAEHFAISRQAVNNHIGRLVADGYLTAHGATRSRRYSLTACDEKEFMVPLGEGMDETLISRAQARRLLTRFGRFKKVMLDFQGVEQIGQSFADEVFRVFARAHPDVEIVPVNVNPEVDAMIRHVCRP